MCRCIGKIIARDLRLVTSRLYRMAITRPWSRAAVTSFLSLGGDLLGCIDRTREKKRKALNISCHVRTRTNSKVPLPIGTVRYPFGGFGPRGNSTSHWLISGGGKTRADAIYTGPRSNEVIKYEEKRREETEERNAQLITFLRCRDSDLNSSLSHSRIPTASDLPSSAALVARVSRHRSLSEFFRVVELPLMTWHRWELPLPASAVAVGNHQLYPSIM